jgi:hypothetical protein
MILLYTEEYDGINQSRVVFNNYRNVLCLAIAMLYISTKRTGSYGNQYRIKVV